MGNSRSSIQSAEGTWRCPRCGNANSRASATCLGCGTSSISARTSVVEIDNHLLSQEDYQTLQFSPFWVFSAIAQADGKVDKKEVAAFAKLVSEAELFTHPFVREVMKSISTDFNSTWVAYRSDSRAVAEALEEVAGILDANLDSQDAMHFKRALLGIAIQIAEASGGILGLGQKASKEEKLTFAFIAIQLGVKLEELG